MTSEVTQGRSALDVSVQAAEQAGVAYDHPYRLLCENVGFRAVLLAREDARIERETPARLTAKAGEGRSGTGEEVDPSKMSVEMAELFGLVCKLERLKLERDDLMRTDVGFAMIERAADMMDEIVDSVPELKAAFAKVHAREASYRAALNARQSGEGERLREAAAGVLAHRVDGSTRGWLRDNRDSRAALDALAAALRATDDAGGAK